MRVFVKISEFHLVMHELMYPCSYYHRFLVWLIVLLSTAIGEITTHHRVAEVVVQIPPRPLYQSSKLQGGQGPPYLKRPEEEYLPLMSYSRPPTVAW